MTLSTTPATARTDVTAPGRAPAGAVPRSAIRAAGAAVSVGAAAWAASGLYYGFDDKSNAGIVAGDLTGFLFQCGVMALVTIQMRTRATGTKPISRKLLQVERLLLIPAMVWSVLHALVPSQRDEVWLGVLDIFWPLSMLGMFLIGMKIAFRGRWRGLARVWSGIAETWVIATVPLFLIFDQSVDLVGSLHLLFGYSTLGLILLVRPDLAEDRD